MSASYAEDGSKIITVKINNKTIKKVYDSNGNIRQQIVVNKKDNTKTVSNYDSTGKLNYKEVTNTKNDLKVSSEYYDDNGQLSRKNTTMMMAN